jgi:hypothetical protein
VKSGTGLASDPAVISHSFEVLLTGSRRGPKDVLLKDIVDEALTLSSTGGHDVQVCARLPSMHTAGVMPLAVLFRSDNCF